MSPENGFNPMRYECEESGCFNKKRRPKIEVFADCFPGRINFGDVDGEVEINTYFCQLEWKTGTTNIPTGQRIKFERYTKLKRGNIVFVVDGDAGTMRVEGFCRFFDGEQRPWQAAELEDVKAWIKKWAKCARGNNFPQAD